MAEPSFYGRKPQTRDVSAFTETLGQWVADHLGREEPVRLTGLAPTSEDANGYAGESFVLETARTRGGRTRVERYLLKRKPTQHRYFPEHDFEAEFRIQDILARDGRVPMAPVFGYEADPAVLGSPFYLLGFVDGRPVPDRPFYYADGWLADLSAGDQRAVSAAGLAALARIHAIALHECGAGFLHRAAPGGRQIDWDLAWWDRYSAVSWTADGPLGRVPEGRTWLEANKPAHEDLVISWGDARPGNILFKDLKAAAVIDWDLVSSGDPEKDLGYLLTMDLSAQRFAEKLGGGVRLTGWPSRAEMVDLYEQAAGKPVDRKKLRFHRIFAAYQIACMYARYLTMQKNLDAAARAQFLNEDAPPIDLMREELESAHLPGCAN